jgi:hypothetical protein
VSGVAQSVRISVMTQTAQLLDDDHVIAERRFGPGESEQTLFARALELGQNFPALIALLWPERVESNGHSRT